MLQDKRFKNRELQIMKMVDHPNIVKLKHCFYSHTDKDETYLHLVLEFVPDTVYRISKHYAKNNQRMPNIFVKLYAYQMCRSLAAIHRTGICHRDIKPQNLLVNTECHCLKLCDFGSAKVCKHDAPAAFSIRTLHATRGNISEGWRGITSMRWAIHLLLFLCFCFVHI